MDTWAHPNQITRSPPSKDNKTYIKMTQIWLILLNSSVYAYNFESVRFADIHDHIQILAPCCVQPKLVRLCLTVMLATFTASHGRGIMKFISGTPGGKPRHFPGLKYQQPLTSLDIRQLDIQLCILYWPISNNIHVGSQTKS